MRQCKRCEYEGIKDTFPKAGKVNGVQYYRHICKTCYGKQKSGRKRLVKKLADKIKQDVKCIRCGNNNWRVIDWHHRYRNTKSFSIGGAMTRGYSLKKIAKEIEKCTPLCANCHRIVEYEIRHNI